MNIKAFSTDMTLADGSREVLVRMTSSAVDNDNEVLLPQGMDATSFMGSVFIDHSQQPTGGGYLTRDLVGKVVEMKRQADHWLAKVMLLPRPAGHTGEWMADTVLDLCKHGLLGVSVGFQIIESRRPTDKDFKAFGEDVKRVISKWKLRELSFTPMPCNEEAVVLAVAKGVKREAISRYWPKALPQVNAVSLADLVSKAWRAAAPQRREAKIASAVGRMVEMQAAKRRGVVYWRG